MISFQTTRVTLAYVRIESELLFPVDYIGRFPFQGVCLPVLGTLFNINIIYCPNFCFLEYFLIIEQ